MVIRDLKTWAEFRACEEIQREVWGNIACSAELLGVTQKCGGAVLGAIIRGEVAGFLFAFLARRHGRLIHWSHLMAVRAGFRDRGLGYRMKLGHRRLALEQGIRFIGWTYDPLESRNALLNIHRLGARIEEYIPDCYGDFPSRIEKGLPSDRMVACWPLASRQVDLRLRQKSAPKPDLSSPCINQSCAVSGGFLENHRIAWNLSARRLRLEIPGNTDAMRARAFELARKWRRETRKIFQHYFAQNYHVVDFLRVPEDGRERCFYVLGRGRP
ncbi:MAG TPA: hypothetical protein VFZ08_11045 [Terriglobia bacterium]|nr:hypothetical protein [Terriglobia bacterium]